MPLHRRPPKHRRPPRHRVPGNQGRRQPARLTLAVAAATTVVVGAVSAGVAVAAAGPPDGHAAGSVAAAAASGVSRQAAAILAQQQHSHQDAAHHQAAPRPGTASAPAARASGPAQRPAATAQASQQPRAGKDYLIYDSLLPGALPSGQVIATYATGAKAVQPAELAGRGPVLWIDTEATDPGANALDVEPGCATPAAVPTWITDRLSAHPGALAIIYTSLDEWPLVQSEVAGLPAAMRAQVRWWIADPTGYPHIIPGSDATQWYWGPSYDISTATPRFLVALGPADLTGSWPAGSPGRAVWVPIKTSVRRAVLHAQPRPTPPSSDDLHHRLAMTHTTV